MVSRVRLTKATALRQQLQSNSSKASEVRNFSIHSQIFKKKNTETVDEQKQNALLTNEITRRRQSSTSRAFNFILLLRLISILIRKIFSTVK